MSVSVDLRVVELLCPRLCHELLGPVSAVNNGLELLSEGDRGMVRDVVDLLTSSADEAGRRLRFYRIAYGLGGGVTRQIGEIHDLAAGLLQGGRLSLDWPKQSLASLPDVAREANKLLLNLVLLAAETLPSRGTVNVELKPTMAGVRAAVTAVGQGARLDEDKTAALVGTTDVDELDPRTVHAYFTSRLAEEAGTSIHIDTPATDVVEFVADLSAST